MENYMWLNALVFYVFAFVLIISALFVVFSKNPVHSVLFLILTFFNASALFILEGAEFIGFTLLVVYAGAVAIMFLFVVMFIDIDTHTIKGGLIKALPVALILGLIFLAELIVAFVSWKIPLTHVNSDLNLAFHATQVSNITDLGLVIYTRFFHIFQMGGLVLLVGMLGAISLTLRDKREDFKTQDISQQLERTYVNTLRIVQSEPQKNDNEKKDSENEKSTETDTANSNSNSNSNSNKDSDSSSDIEKTGEK